MSKIIVDTLESSGTTVTVNDAIDAGTNAVTAGSITGLSASSLTTGTLPNAQLADGHILQIQSASFQGIQTIGTSDTDVTNLTCTMTITSGNKVFITASAFIGREQDDYGYLNITDGSNTVIYENNTGTGNQTNGSLAVTNSGSVAGDQYKVDNHSLGYLWTPGVTSITVKVRAQCVYGSNIYINRPQNTADAAYVVRATSHLTIMEFKA